MMAFALSYEKFDDPEYTPMMLNKLQKPAYAQVGGAKTRSWSIFGFKRTTYEVNAAAMMAADAAPPASRPTPPPPTCDSRKYGRRRWCALAAAGALLIAILIAVVYVSQTQQRTRHDDDEISQRQRQADDGRRTSLAGAVPANKSDEVEEEEKATTTPSGVGHTTAAAALPADYPHDSPVSETMTATTTTTPMPRMLLPAEWHVEFVTPVKQAPKPLHAHDKIYDETRNIKTSSRMADATTMPTTMTDNNDSSSNNNNNTTPKTGDDAEDIANPLHLGHFRDRSAEVFDPHPEYVINVTNRKMMVLELSQNMNFHPQVVAVDNNTSVKHNLEDPACYYTGAVRGEKNSHVGVSLCNGMTGYIKTAQVDYQIAPDEEYDAVRHSKTSIRHRLTTLPKDARIVQDHDNDEIHSHADKKRRFARSRRSAEEGNHPHQNGPYYIETLVVTDRKMIEYHKTEDDLTRYILTLMSHAALLFKDATVGNPIDIVVVDIMILKHREFKAPSSPEVLKQFCEFQHKESHKKHDVALLLTRNLICTNASVETCTTLGIAEVGSMCSPSKSCAIVRDKGLSTSFTIAHELGHVLSMAHDDDTRCGQFSQAPNFIMARSLHHETQPWHWSQCSKHYLTEFLTSPSASCLLDIPHEDHIRDNPLGPKNRALPGEAFQADRQCELEFGPGSRICPFMPPCSTLWCTHEYDTRDEDSGCKTQHMPWADGTPCAHKKWCFQGNCTSKNYFTEVPGGWGPFRPHGNCTRPCGGGIQMSVRECNNPTPAHGGSYCTGPSHLYQSCNTHDCPKNTPDFREMQCARFNGDHKKLLGLDSNVRWVPKYGTNSEDACKLYCRVDLSSSYFLLRNKVLDGTKCGLNSYDICVNGVCMEGGCDNVLASNVTLDDCGTCGGNNKECCKISGFYNSTDYGYHHVVQIPKGSTNIHIVQGSDPDSKDENYLALREPETSRSQNRYLLNGYSMISGYAKDIIYGGLTFTYSGSNNTKEESIMTPPKARLRKDIIVEILQVGNLTYPNITWSYTIACKDAPKYSWEYYKDKWTDCNSICRGYRYPLMKCKDIERNVEVDRLLCKSQPRENAKECNTHCELQWQVTGKGPCSSYCGSGWRNITHECVEIHAGNKQQRVIDNQHCAGLSSPPNREHCDGTCETIRWEYGDWGECTKSCGGGYQKRSAVCVNSFGDTVDESYCAGQEKHTKQSCGEGKCPTWFYHDWSPCSVSCGTGIRRRQASCRIGNQLGPHHFCTHQRQPLEEPCSIQECLTPIWMTGDWNECSGPCGESYQRRLVTCMDADTQSKIPEEKCDSVERPRNTQSCLMVACSVEWITTNWGNCSKRCGEGTQSRKVVCMRKDGQPQEDFACGGAKPADSRPCSGACPQDRIEVKLRHFNSHHAKEQHFYEHVALNRNYYKPEGSYKWVAQRYHRCSTSCGTGYRNRTVSCILTTPDGSSNTVADALCNDVLQKPQTSSTCRRYNCEYAWLESDWSNCSKSCGRGIRTRSVTCNKVHRDPVLHFSLTDIRQCAIINKPVSRERCSEMECNDHFRWKVGEWERCKSPCKEEKQTRKVQCMDRSGNRVDNRHCLALKRLKPRRRRKCGSEKCRARSCKEYQWEQKQRGNGPYWLRLHNKPVEIYCYQMDSPNPQEFISLIDLESNYAEVFQDKWGCSEGSRSGPWTKFYKLRLDVYTMKIIPDDFTFSSNSTQLQIPLGTAGDCFDRGCTRGRFQINLTGTPFRIASNIGWIPYGQSPTKRISQVTNKIVSGYCGGNCGGCKINPHIGLKVEIT